MSDVVLKRKTNTQYQKKHAFNSVGNYDFWMLQGPHTITPTFGKSGFSINGSRRFISVGKDMKFSQRSGSQLRLSVIQADQNTRISPPLFDNINIIEGNNHLFNKPSVLSTYGMLHKKYKRIYYGQFPNYWVKPDYGSSNLSLNKSQGTYIHNKNLKNNCVIDINNPPKISNNSIPCICKPIITKFTKSPLTYEQYLLFIQRQCANIKPFPPATNGNCFLP